METTPTKTFAKQYFWRHVRAKVDQLHIGIACTREGRQAYDPMVWRRVSREWLIKQLRESRFAGVAKQARVSIDGKDWAFVDRFALGTILKNGRQIDGAVTSLITKQLETV